MKTVFNNRECCHVWAQQKQETGRGPSIFFEGKSIFSYGRHFEMARFISDDVVLFTSRSYSVTTAKHLSFAYQAVSHKKTFTVSSFENHSENAKELAQNVENYVDSIMRKLSDISYHLETLSRYHATALDYLSTFKKAIEPDVRKKINALEKYIHAKLPQKRIDELKAREEKFNAGKEERWKAKRAREEEARRIRQLEYAERVELWKTGEYNGPLYGVYGAPVALRIKNDNIETSQGASIPLSAARLFWDTLKDGKPVHGIELGSYTVNSLADGVLTVGCHKIPLKEVYRMAVALNWSKEEVL
jgi:hypothetical protein